MSIKHKLITIGVLGCVLTIPFAMSALPLFGMTAGILLAQDATAEQVQAEPASTPASSAGVGGGGTAETVAAPGDPTADAPPSAPSTPPAMDAGSYAVRLRALEQRINELKEQIFRSKARLSLLAETVLQGVVAGSQAKIVHENKMSSTFRLVKVSYALDGARIFNRADDEGGLGQREQFEVYSGNIVPGEHNLTVNLEYRGYGSGIFSYLQGYRFRVRSAYTFTAPEGKAVNLRVVGYEKGGPTAQLEEKPAIRYVERVTEISRGEHTEATPEAH